MNNYNTYVYKCTGGNNQSLFSNYKAETGKNYST